MKTVQLNRHTRIMLEEFSVKGETIDDALNRLLDSSNILNTEESIDLSKTNISIHEDTFERLLQYKLAPHESHSDTILRLLLVLMHESTVI